MMAITEEALKEADDKCEGNSEDEEDGESDFGGIPVEFLELYNDEELKQTLIDLILTASDLDILDFQVRKKIILKHDTLSSQALKTSFAHFIYCNRDFDDTDL
jgi:hypothetical protein